MDYEFSLSISNQPRITNQVIIDGQGYQNGYEILPMDDSYSSDTINKLVDQTFRVMTGKELPPEIIIMLCDEEKMRRNHPKWTPGLGGFAINTYPPMIFIMKDRLEVVMTVIGHELGHLFGKSISDIIDEEAKAHAFSIAWVGTIKEHNIGNLAEKIGLLQPADNGIHDVAMNFVLKKIKDGISPREIFLNLTSRKSSCTDHQ